MKISGQEFTNSSTCKGVTFTPANVPLDFAEITISGRYPAEGWAVNHKAHEMVRVQRGFGTLAIRGAEETKLLQGDVVHVPPETPFAWNGDMTIHMACSPPFDSAQYEIIEEDKA